MIFLLSWMPFGPFFFVSAFFPFGFISLDIEYFDGLSFFFIQLPLAPFFFISYFAEI